MPRSRERSTEPTAFPQTTPPVTGEHGVFVLTSITRIEGALGRLEGKIDSLQDQIGRMDTKVDTVDKEVHGHGKWIHTLQVFAGFAALILGWIFVNAVWPMLRAKLGVPG